MFDYTAERITEALKRHPKSLIYRTEEDRSRVLNNPNLAKFRSDLDSCLEYYMEKPICSIPFSMLRRFEDDGDRSEYEYSDKGYFVRRGHLEIKLIAAWLYPERKDVLDALQDIMWAICDEYTWSLPAHMNGEQALRVNLQEDCYTIDLFAAETGDTLAEALLMLGDRLDPVVVKRVKRELKKRIIDRFENGRFGWCESNFTNWAAVCAGSVGMACICELDDDQRLGRLIERLLGAMRNFMSGFSDDGACLEGTGYWSYGFGYFACFADMLYRRTGGEIDLFDDPRVHKVALFPQKCCFYGSRGVSFSDGGSKVSLSLGLTNMLSKHFDDVFIPENVYTGDGISIGGCHRFSLGFNKILWTPEGEVKRVPMADNYQLPSAQWYIASGKDNVGVAIKGGNNGEPHNHNDIGNFIVYKNGVEIIADLGSGEYDKKYFSRERYTLTHCGSQGHSVPLIDGAVQKAGKAYAAKDFTMDSTGVCMDIAPAYGLGGDNSVIREIRFDREAGVLTVSDRFKLAKAPDRLVERFISRFQPVLTVDGVTIGNNNASMLLTITEGAAAAHIHSSEEKDHGGKPFTVWYVDFVANMPDAECSFKFKLS
ncbi:MAG: heparinase II/III family protein [Clostridia bacterium]|nr:heparinase II/III family protein [Clostridia bacterium]